ncbi:chloride channel [Lipomyces japonicus]|uniref:chloride channel n=1 Tax=Lipomyces japonicus TaxID=56871 RepID=UPI0034CF3FD7
MENADNDSASLNAGDQEHRSLTPQPGLPPSASASDTHELPGANQPDHRTRPNFDLVNSPSLQLPPTVRFDLHSPGIIPRSSLQAHFNKTAISGNTNTNKDSHHHNLRVQEVFPYQASPTSPLLSQDHVHSDESVEYSSSDLRLETISPAGATTHSVNAGTLSAESSAAIADKRFWYDDFTTIDWVHDYIKESFRVKRLRDIHGLRGRFVRARDAMQGWLLISVIGSSIAGVAYLIDFAEQRIFDWRSGYCATNWLDPKRTCCANQATDEQTCAAWLEWRLLFHGSFVAEYFFYIFISVVLASLAVILTLTTKSTTPFAKSTQLEHQHVHTNTNLSDGAPVSLSSAEGSKALTAVEPRRVIYTAAGGGVAEVKTILSGFVIKKFLGSYTLFIKSIALVLSISSGLNVGKEGPYVHIAACVGNIACRFFTKFNNNDGKRREILSAAASAGVAVAFGSPLGGVLFSLEEVSYYFPPKTLIRSFLCAVISALVLKLLNPYGTGKIVIFEVSYDQDWHAFEFLIFVFIGVCGGVMGALFGRINIWWSRTFRSLDFIKKRPIFEVVVTATITSAISFFNVHTKKAASELLFDLARPCNYQLLLADGKVYEGDDLCPVSFDKYGPTLLSLGFALIIKFVLTATTVGLKLPAGIYVPSMVSGALFGRIVGLSVQWLQYKFPGMILSQSCPAGSDPRECTIAGVYAIVGAGAMMAGVTRMTVTLAVILFELTGSLDHVLPISVAIIVSKWVAQALEPASLYDTVMQTNNFPFLDNQRTPGFSATLHDIVPKSTIAANSTVIDITDTPYASAKSLRTRISVLQASDELDGSLPILRNQILVGLLPVPELEYALDKIKERDAVANGYPHNNLAAIPDSPDMLCHISVDEQEAQRFYQYQEFHHHNHSNVAGEVTDLTPFVDRSPISLDITSPLAMVHLMFIRLGLRMICVVENGKFWGVLHKKKFIDYCRFGEDNMETWF